MIKTLTIALIFSLFSTLLHAEGDSTEVKKDSSKFDSFNAKMERLLK